MTVELYTHSYSSEITFMTFFEEKSNLVVGLNNGYISILKVYIHETADITKNLVDEIFYIQCHETSISSAIIDYSLGFIFSIAKSNKISLSEINYKSNVHKETVSKFNLTSICFDESRKILICSDSQGSIYFYYIQSAMLSLIQAVHNEFSQIKYMKFIKDENLLFVNGWKSDNNKGIHIFSLRTDYSNKIEMENIFKYKLSEGFEVSSLLYKVGRILIVGFTNGAISIYNTKDDFPSCNIYII